MSFARSHVVVLLVITVPILIGIFYGSRVAADVAIVLGHAVDPGRGLAAGTLHMTFERKWAFLDLRRLFLGAVGGAPAVQVLALLRRKEQAAKFFRGRRGGRGEARKQQHQRNGEFALQQTRKADASAAGPGMTILSVKIVRDVHDSL
mgnify:CR=1 FL=1